MNFLKLSLILSVVAPTTAALAQEIQSAPAETVVTPDVKQTEGQQQEVEKKEEAHQELVNPFVDGSAIPTPVVFDSEEEATKIFRTASSLSHLESSIKQDSRLAQFLVVINDIKKAPKNAFNYETQYPKLTAAIRHRFGANLMTIIKFIKN